MHKSLPYFYFIKFETSFAKILNFLKVHILILSYLKNERRINQIQMNLMRTLMI